MKIKFNTPPSIQDSLKLPYGKEAHQVAPVAFINGIVLSTVPLNPATVVILKSGEGHPNYRFLIQSWLAFFSNVTPLFFEVDPNRNPFRRAIFGPFNNNPVPWLKDDIWRVAADAAFSNVALQMEGRDPYELDMNRWALPVNFKDIQRAFDLPPRIISQTATINFIPKDPKTLFSNNVIIVDNNKIGFKILNEDEEILITFERRDHNLLFSTHPQAQKLRKIPEFYWPLKIQQLITFCNNNLHEGGARFGSAINWRSIYDQDRMLNFPTDRQGNPQNDTLIKFIMSVILGNEQNQYLIR